MLGWLIYTLEDSIRNREAIRMFQDAGAKLDMEIELKIFDSSQSLVNQIHDWAGRMCLTEEIRLPNFVINRSRSFELGKWLETHGVRVFNSSEVTRICNDKITTLEYVKKLGVPTLPWISGDVDEFHLGMAVRYPLVAKSCDGHGGNEVFWIDNGEALWNARERFKGRKWMLQKAASEPGKDLRVYVLGGQIIKGMLRYSEQDFRSNFCLGGSVKEYELSEKECELVKAITEKLHLDYAGIDFLFHEGSLVLNEIEDVVGARMLYTFTDLDIISDYIKYIKNFFA